MSCINGAIIILFPLQDKIRPGMFGLKKESSLSAGSQPSNAWLSESTAAEPSIQVGSVFQRWKQSQRGDEEKKEAKPESGAQLSKPIASC